MNLIIAIHKSLTLLSWSDWESRCYCLVAKVAAGTRSSRTGPAGVELDPAAARASRTSAQNAHTSAALLELVLHQARPASRPSPGKRASKAEAPAALCCRSCAGQRCACALVSRVWA